MSFAIATALHTFFIYRKPKYTESMNTLEGNGLTMNKSLSAKR
ncbi:hypothetical protein [Pedobacter sp. ASV28]|nr:hypothetical protein [Pedobacter sp. ASV28]